MDDTTVEALKDGYRLAKHTVSVLEQALQNTQAELEKKKLDCQNIEQRIDKYIEEFGLLPAEKAKGQLASDPED